MTSVKSLKNEDNKKKKLDHLVKLISEISNQSSNEHEIKKTMKSAGLKYTRDPIARIDLIMKELDFLENSER